MLPSRFAKHLLRDWLLYFEFTLVLSVVYLIVGQALLGGLFARLGDAAQRADIKANVTAGLSSLLCWLVLCGGLARLEYKRGFKENRMGEDNPKVVIAQRLLSLALTLAPLVVFYRAIRYSEFVLLATYRGYLWAYDFLGGSNTWTQALAMALGLFALTGTWIALGYGMGYRKFKRAHARAFAD